MIDPSAGSPTNTLLRLLHPPQTDVQVPSDRPEDRSVRQLDDDLKLAVATGGVYKGQGLIHGALMTRHYEVFRVHEEKLQASIPTEPIFRAVCRFSRTNLRAPIGIVLRVRPKASWGITDLPSP